ncbi:MAG: O-antigen ligase family protein [Patescibacteria group bacterium]
MSAKIGLLHWLRRVEYMSLFVVGFIYLKNIFTKGEISHFLEYLIKLLLIVNLIVFLYGLGQRYFNLPVIITQNEEYSKGVALRWTPGAHINSSFAGHYDLASYLVLTMPLFISAFFYYKDKYSKIILGASILIGFWLFSVAVSRISIVAFLMATTISLFLLKKYKEIIVVVAISLVAFGFSPDLRTRYQRIFDVVKQRLSTLVIVSADEGNVNEDRSTSIRFNVEWPRAIRAFYKNPLLGTGYSSITLATDNDYLRALGETGILGLMSLLLIFISLYNVIGKYQFDESLDSVLIASFIGSTIGILLTAVFIDIFEASKFAINYWLITGIVVGIIKKKEYA